ncbi:MAG: T9SS type A sorting domain-containing protein [Ignavibacteriae bacterium]|nr:T9SS type A sorting domain-containing protein [Ignavibacteriota bacterium]MCB9221034.1 T9SS type A sorting domain-containing protein [Ignavibacteria bacterium]
MNKLILLASIFYFCQFFLLAQFKVVQSNPKNYSFNNKENAHQLTDGSNRMQATAIWNNSSIAGFEKIDINKNFLVEAEYYLGYKDKEGADGIAFVLQSDGDDKLGSLGVGMGYAANIYDGNKKVSPSLGIELDTWFNYPGSPPAVDVNPEDHFGYVVNGNLMDRIGIDRNAKEDIKNRPLNIEDSTFHCVKFFWNTETKELSSYLDGQLRKTERFDGSTNRSLNSIIQTDLAFWGFTTGTATRDNIHMVRFDQITRENEACFVEIYKDTPLDTSNPNCGYEEISVCKENPDSQIELSLTTTKLPIDNIVWQSKNNNTNIAPLNSQKDKVRLLMKDNDIVEVTVYYSNGCIAKDEFLINAKGIEIAEKLDTIRLCQSNEIEIDFDMIIDGKKVDNSDLVEWDWTNKEYIVNKGELTDKERIYLKNSDSDTITFVVTASVKDDLNNICSDEKEITVIKENYYFEEIITYSPCADTAYIEVKVFEDKDHKIPLAEDKIQKLFWFSPKSQDDFVEGKFPEGYIAIVITEGRYDLNIDLKNGCFISKSIFADFSKNNMNLLPSKLEICHNDSIEVESEIEASKYLWSTGESTKSITITEAGIYTLEIEAGEGCIFYDTLEVIMLPKLDFNITGDSIICKNGDFINLRTDTKFEKYKWSTGSNATNININSPGLYWLKATDRNGCVAYDSINVVSFDSIYVNIISKGGCNTDSAMLTYETNSSDYTVEWSNNSTEDTIWVTKDGLYSITLKDAKSGCEKTSKLKVEIVNGFYPELVGDTTICEGEVTELEVIGCLDCSYEWIDGSVDSKAKFKDNAKGFVVVTKNNSCIDTLFYEIKKGDIPNPKILGSLKVCFPDSTILFVEGDYKSIKWSNGSDENSIYVKESGIYSIEVESELGCFGYDTVFVELIDIKKELEYKDTINFGKVYLADKVSFQVELKSKFTKSIDISSFFDGNQKRFELQDKRVLDYSFTPVKIGVYNNTIEFVVEQPCLDTFYVYVVGEVYTKVVLELPQIIAYPGDVVDIPIKLRSNINLNDYYQFDLKFDSEIIFFENKTNPMAFGKDWNLNSSEQIIENPSGTVLLTDLSKKHLIVDTLEWKNKFIESEIINGWIRLDTICTHEYRVVEISYENISTFYEVGSNRLIIQKNGSSESLDVELTITNLSGATVFGYVIEVDNSSEIDLTNLASGVYFVRVEYKGLSNLYKFIKFE